MLGNVLLGEFLLVTQPCERHKIVNSRRLFKNKSQLADQKEIQMTGLHSSPAVTLAHLECGLFHCV